MHPKLERPMAADLWHFAGLTRDDLCVKAAEATVVVPLGSTEQHAHHLPVSVDAAIVTAIAERSVGRAAAEVPILLAPTLPFGFAHHHLPFGGTVSLRASTYVDVLTDIATSLAGEGFRRLVFLNGHGGNESAMRLAADRVSYELRLDLAVAAASYWSVAAAFLATSGLPGNLIPGHAGHFESSLMLALSPDVVRLDRRPNDDSPATLLGRAIREPAHVQRPGVWESSDGRTDDANLADEQHGTRLFEGIVESVTGFLIRFHRSV
jgi:creatinine amidohydrolase